jgi:hypothetical protein
MRALDCFKQMSLSERPISKFALTFVALDSKLLSMTNCVDQSQLINPNSFDQIMDYFLTVRPRVGAEGPSESSILPAMTRDPILTGRSGGVHVGALIDALASWRS